MANLIPFVVFAVFVLFSWAVLYYAHGLSRRLVSRTTRAIAARIDEDAREGSPFAPWLWFAVVGALGLGIVVAGGWLFAAIAADVFVEGSVLFEIDETIHARATELRTEPLHWFFMAMAAIGEKEGLAIMLIAAALIAAVRREWALAIWALLTGAGGGIANRLLKLAFERERPDLAIAAGEASGFSFPSGHTMGSFIVLSTIVWVTLRLTESRKVASLAVACGIAGVAAISGSRIYLGVHWSTDIAAGLSAGAVWFVLCLVLYETARRARSIRRAIPGSTASGLPD